MFPFITLPTFLGKIFASTVLAYCLFFLSSCGGTNALNVHRSMRSSTDTPEIIDESNKNVTIEACGWEVVSALERSGDGYSDLLIELLKKCSQDGSLAIEDLREYAILAAKLGEIDVLYEAAFPGGVALDLQDGQNRTLLALAALKNHTAMVGRLLADGAQVNAVDELGNTPLHLSAELGNEQVAELLLSWYANVKAKNNGGNTPLHLASEKDQVQVAKLLLNWYANIEGKNENCSTPLHLAAKAGNLDMVQFLISEADPRANREAKDKNNHTSLYLSIDQNARSDNYTSQVTEFLLGKCLKLDAQTMTRVFKEHKCNAVNNTQPIYRNQMNTTEKPEDENVHRSNYEMLVNSWLRENCTTSGSGGMSLGPVQMAKRLIVGTGSMALPYVETGRQTVTDWVGSGFNEASLLLSHYALSCFSKGYQKTSQQIAAHQPASELDEIDAKVSRAIDIMEEKYSDPS